MNPSVGYRFFSVPNHRMFQDTTSVPPEEMVEPVLPGTHEAVEKALAGADFRDMRARDRLRNVLFNDRDPKLLPAGVDRGPAGVFARPPDDLPALLRLADQLDSLANTEAGERAIVWKCDECGTRYAVPVALVRRVSIRCEKCSKPIELRPEKSVGEEALIEPFRGEINHARRRLADFFREAMARGWPVLVCSTDN